MKQPAVFISATNTDYSAARQVYQLLTERGIDCFFSDESLLRVGERGYRAKVDKALDSVGQLFVVAGSRTQVESEWVRHAWSRFARGPDAQRREGSVVTVLCEGLEPSDLPRPLRCGRWIRFPEELERLHNAVMNPGEPVPAAMPANSSRSRPGGILTLVTICNVLVLCATIWLLWRNGLHRLFEESIDSGRRTALTDGAPRAATPSSDPETLAVAKAVREFPAKLLARLGNNSVDPETHPAAKVVREYLTMILARQWNQSADIVDEESLSGLKEDYLKRIQSARTMDEEQAMFRRVGKESKDEVQKMTSREFYTAYHAGLQERYKVDEDVLRIIRESLTVRLLGLGQEGDRTVHILAQTKHTNGKVLIQNLELITLRKNGEKWQVALNEQAPKVTALDDRKLPSQGPGHRRTQ